MIGSYKYINNNEASKTTLLLLPLLFEGHTCKSVFGQELYGKHLQKGWLLNAFLNDLNTPTLDNHIFLLMDDNLCTDDNLLWKFKDKSTYYENSKIVDYNKLYIRVRFVRPLKYRFDINEILNGKYSNISNVTKNTIKKFWENNIYIKSILDKTNYYPVPEISTLQMQDNGELLPKINIYEESLPEEHQTSLLV